MTTTPLPATDGPAAAARLPDARDGGPHPVLAATAGGFLAAVAMWAVGYVAHLPGLSVPGWVTLPVMLLALFEAGRRLARHAGASVREGAAAGAVAGLVNLLVLGSLLARPEDGGLVPAWFVWLPGSLAVHAGVAAAGAAAGRPRPSTTRPDAAGWRFLMALAAAAATLLVVIAGGLVTSTETGLAVPDWPNSFGSNMFLYPLARMTGGIYFEHAHRLYGSLVGLSIMVLMVMVLAGDDRRPWLRTFAIGLFVAVCVQGTLGGLRVTGSFTMSQEGADLAPSTALAIVHGVGGQLVFLGVTLLAAALSPWWRGGISTGRSRAPVPVGQAFAVLVTAAMIGQLVLGALYRHTYTVDEKMPWPAHAHLSFAAVVIVLGVMLGLRAWSRRDGGPVLPRVGGALLILIGTQLVLGIAALVAVLARQDPVPPALEVVLATAHQANGALVLVLCGQAAAWLVHLGRHGAPAMSPQDVDASSGAGTVPAVAAAG